MSMHGGTFKKPMESMVHSSCFCMVVGCQPEMWGCIGRIMGASYQLQMRARSLHAQAWLHEMEDHPKLSVLKSIQYIQSQPLSEQVFCRMSILN